MSDQETAASAADETVRPAVSDRTRRGLRTALISLLAFLVVLFAVLVVFTLRMLVPVGAPDRASMPEGLTWMRSIYGWGRAESQQLRAPSDVAIDSKGVVWVTDPQRWQVVGFNPDGTFKSIIHRGPGRMMPQVIAIGDEDEIYIGDNVTSQIRVFSADNRELRSFPVSMPTELAVKDGKVAVGMVGALAVYTDKGELIKAWTGRGTGEDEFDIVHGIAIGEDGTIYISDTQNHRVKAYDLEKGLKWVYPSGVASRTVSMSSAATATRGQPYQLPAGMTFDAKGRLLLVDPFEFRIDVVNTSNGKLVKSYGSFGAADGRFSYPTSIAYDAKRDWFAIADTGNDRVQLMRVAGSGGSPFAPVRRVADGALWILLLPLLAAAAAALVMLIRRRIADRASGTR